VALLPGDLLMLRTNPARDPDRLGFHRACFAFARMARDQGVTVLNDPDAIERAGSKLYLLELPQEIRPRQLVTARFDELLAFARAEPGPVVLKPLWGTRGDGVVLVARGDEAALRTEAETLIASGPLVAQEYLHAAPQGDTRVLMLDGEVITIEGKRCAVRRVPQPGEFRSNVHLGAEPAPAVWSEGLDRVARTVGPYLKATGVFLAGIDVVGEHLVEVNSYAPGGFMNAEAQEGVDFLGAVLDAALARARATAD
jgi:glutathione synthase